MKCTSCLSKTDKVLDTRISSDGERQRRTRQCLNCKHRQVTVEVFVDSIEDLMKAKHRWEQLKQMVNKVD